ncbi:MAG: hypothetical protein KH123_08240 [Azospirillum sp.]|nr:hypothetical protein [Azospirillum sp.]
MEKELSLTIIHNDQGEEGCLLSQDDMRQLLRNVRREAQLTFEALGKLCDIDPEILQDYEEGIYNLRPEAYRLMPRELCFQNSIMAQANVTATASKSRGGHFHPCGGNL